MWLDHLNRVFKGDWTVTLDLKLFRVGLAKDAAYAHVYYCREQLGLFAVDHWESVDRH